MLSPSRSGSFAAALCLIAAFGSAQGSSGSVQRPAGVRNADGLQLLVATEHTHPALHVVLPGHAASDRSIEVLFPEHVTAVRRGSTGGQQLYMFRPGQQGDPPAWRQAGRSLEYRRDLPGNVQLLARATLEDDGVRIGYEFTNASTVAYDMITAITDPRLTGIFHDLRLERTYVHHPDGFDLLASEVPMRLTLPRERWLPARVLASYTWPVSTERVEDRGDGISYYQKSRAVDAPFLATRSADGSWVVASFSRETGNVWSNPELTCQHADPQTPLAPGQRVTREVKILVIHGTLDDALARARRQRESLK